MEKVASPGTATSKASTTLTLRDARTGAVVVVRGTGALAGSGFTLREGIGLSEPIAEQVLARTVDAG